jgi:hypothetical protein
MIEKKSRRFSRAKMENMQKENGKHAIRKWPWKGNKSDDKNKIKRVPVSNAFDGDGAFGELEKVKAYTKY